MLTSIPTMMDLGIFFLPTSLALLLVLIYRAGYRKGFHMGFEESLTNLGEFLPEYIGILDYLASQKIEDERE